MRGGVWFALGTQQLHLGVEKDFRPALKAHPAFLVRDLGGLRARLQQHGYAPYEDEPLEGYERFYVADPFGNRLELLEPIVSIMSPELIFWYGLALKMALTAIVVVITSVAVERSGPFIGALIAALPTAAGAAYVILAIEHPPSFIAASAIGSLATSAAVSIFSAVYIVLAQRRGLMLSLGVALAIWFAVTAVFRLIDWTPLSAAALNAVVFGITIPLSWRYRTSGPPKKFLRTPL